MYNAMDLSLRSSSSSSASTKIIQKPIARSPWPTIWYRTMWPAFTPERFLHLQMQQPLLPSSWCPKIVDNSSNSSRHFVASGIGGQNLAAFAHTQTPHRMQELSSNSESEVNCNDRRSRCVSDKLAKKTNPPLDKVESHNEDQGGQLSHLEPMSIINIVNTGPAEAPAPPTIDLATCDGPVHFERISNPNFALTVQHCCASSSSSQDEANSGNNNNEPLSSSIELTTKSSIPKSKTYTCIYCHQSFKSLFCYQKHKKRHINPVSVDVSGSSHILTMTMISSERSGTQGHRQQSAKYLNVQFFPCKICGCKFPSYYFVHKHIKICH